MGIPPQEEKGIEGGKEGGKSPGGIYGILIPPDIHVWEEARKLAGDKNFRVEDFAACVSQDPALVIEVLKSSNALFFSTGKQHITSVKTGIVRLGSDVILQILKEIGERPPIEDEDVAHWVEQHRSRCKRTGIVSRMLAEVVAKNYSDECHAAGVLSCVGEILATLHLGEKYVQLAEEHARSGLIYKLAHDLKTDVDVIGPNYLSRQGIPQNIVFAVDKNSTSRPADRAIMKPLVAAAAEMVDAFDSNRWDKLAPGKTLPSKSAIRLLQINDQQYLKLYEKAAQYLFQMRSDEEKRKLGVTAAPPQSASPSPSTGGTSAPLSNPLDDEIANLLSGPAKEPTRDDFSLDTSSKTKSTPRVQGSSQPIQKTELKITKANQVVEAISSVIDKAQSSEELLSSLLEMLIKEGKFKQSAIIVVSKDRKHAIVVAARGADISKGQKLSLDDPLSPLAQSFSKVKSFGSGEAKESPFGSKTFALAPIDADHDTPVSLYADCGESGSITFEARRVFRTVVDLLNQKLPQLPGGILVEI